MNYFSSNSYYVLVQHFYDVYSGTIEIKKKERKKERKNERKREINFSINVEKFGRLERELKAKKKRKKRKIDSIRKIGQVS